MVETTAVPIWSIFTFLAGTQMALWCVFIKKIISERREKKNGNCTDINHSIMVVPENTPTHEHEYVTTQMCSQTQQTIRAEMRLLGTEVTHVKEIVERFEETHKSEHDTMVKHFDQNMKQLKELLQIIKNS